ncbi:glycosyltransferase family 9 protein [Flavisolibacter ginsenosidimutans]|uniref:Glycosyltransferase family 9 protein n=1 Tax=Flavisolibacter ginsenosidimutans TaxID=661481 RepID=A0A5B8UHV5_9BACT|nr:glycosyltransferase family 9 protein [Flavisolibacter ginsenosidimutans]QEC56237.1 glycosyltransferase family 9 protein [Flavisolibacter ginsenosidimutans]
MKFLIIRFSSIGDIVLTTPVVRCLKKQVPDAVIHYLIKPQFKTVMEPNPYVDKFHVLQEDWDAMIEELKEEKFDYVIDLHHNLRTLRVKNALKVPAYSFNKLNLRKLVFVKLKWNVMPKVHIVDRYMETVAPFGVRNDGEGLDYFIPEGAKVPLHDIPHSHHAGFLSIVIGASFYTKKLPVYKLQELCQKINHPIILVGGKEDAKEGEAIASVDPIKVYNACGKFSLHESADLVRQSKLVIAHDTGLMHIAAALKKQVIAVWGSTTPSFGMVPYYGKNFLQRNPPPYDDVQVHKLWCRPCTKIGRNKCPQGHFKCMKEIDVDEIVRLVNFRLGRNGAK